MDKYYYLIEFIFGGTVYHMNIDADQLLFEKPDEGCKPHKSEAKYILDQIKVFLSKEELPFLPHDIIVDQVVNDKNETLFSILT